MAVAEDSDDAVPPVATPAVALVIIDPDSWHIFGREASDLSSPTNSFPAVLGELLRRDDVLVIPVFVNDAPIPVSADMPEHIRSLIRRNGIRLTADDREAGIRRLCDAINTVMVND